MPTNKPLNLERQPVIIGGGPAGLTAAYELEKYNLHPIVIEKLDKVGGIARTENYKGFYFDMGGHRFFTKCELVNQMWFEVLDKDFLLRPRLSRIYYNKKFFKLSIETIKRPDRSRLMAKYPGWFELFSLAVIP